jgi:threonine aldolase
MNQVIDLRSDVCSLPTAAMRAAMATAEIGIDDYSEDPSINRFEQRTAQLLNKEAALFVHGGTMGNLIAVMTHLEPHDSVLISEHFHIFDHEGDAMRRVARCNFQHVPDATHKGLTRLLYDQYEEPTGGQHTAPKLLALENPVCRLGGTLLDMDHMQELRSFADTLRIPVHLDGARLFNAACALTVEPGDLASLVDSVMVDFVKAPAAPAGAVLAGTADFISRARRNRWMLGGHWKQGGVLAAACEIALDTTIDRIAEDHAVARQLAEGLNAIEGLQVDLDQVVTNIVLVEVYDPDIDPDHLKGDVEARGARIGRFKADRRCRLVTHKDVSQASVSRFVDWMAEAVKCCRFRQS